VARQQFVRDYRSTIVAASVISVLYKRRGKALDYPQPYF
jgi:hypothetical protein